MSQEALLKIVERAMKDEAFRALLFANPDKALADYDLSDTERELLSNLNEENFEEFAGKLDDRGTKGWVTGIG